MIKYLWVSAALATAVLIHIKAHGEEKSAACWDGHCIVQEYFDPCVAISQDETSVEECVKAAVTKSGFDWHCTTYWGGPPGLVIQGQERDTRPTEVCTNAVFAFRKLWDERKSSILFEAAKAISKQNLKGK